MGSQKDAGSCVSCGRYRLVKHDVPEAEVSDGPEHDVEELVSGLEALNVTELQQQFESAKVEESESDESVSTRAPVLSSFTLKGVAEYIQAKSVRNVICMCGAGLSVSAGIPDFRSPGTGLYDNLAQYNLPFPEAVFELGFFRSNPEPFYMLSKELAPGGFQATPGHLFVKLLHDKGILRRCAFLGRITRMRRSMTGKGYTQNIDSLESKAGIPAEKIVAAHGNFDTAHCIDCKSAFSLERMKEGIATGKVCFCDCGGLAKPGIVFFGESLPTRFYELRAEDFEVCDMLIILGTSLVVQPFAGLIDLVGIDCPRLLLNREEVGVEMDDFQCKTGCNRGLWFGDACWRDVKHLSDCDDAVKELALHLGWREEFDSMLSEHARAAQHAVPPVTMAQSLQADALDPSAGSTAL